MLIALLAALLATAAHAQTTNQLYMTGTGSGGAPVSTSGVDANINLAIMPKGTGYVGIGTTNPAAKMDIAGQTYINHVTGNAVELTLNWAVVITQAFMTRVLPELTAVSHWAAQ